MIRDLDNLTYKESLKDLGLLMLEKRSILRDLITVFQYKVAVEKTEVLSSQGSTVTGQETMDTSCFIRNFAMGIIKKFSSLRTIKYLSRLSRGVVESPLWKYSRCSLIGSWIT